VGATGDGGGGRREVFGLDIGWVRVLSGA
jgi:hypothetical protein